MRLNRRVIALCVALCAAISASPQALAWGVRGHLVVAMLAEQQLTPQARAAVGTLLAARGPTPLAAVANWPDALRVLDPTEFQRTRRLHYVDFHSADCRYDPPRDCPGGECVVAAIQKYAAILGNRSAPMSERADALAFVVHFVGDIHQPLHADYRNDAGGNRFQVHFDGRGTNLHRVWDSLMIDRAHTTAKSYVRLLQADTTPIATGGTPVQWAEESCRLDRDGGVYPASHRIGEAYVARELPVVDTRLRQAGARLADLLNRELARG